MPNTNIVTRTRKQAFELWIDTLHSGKYKQAKATLREIKVGSDGAVRTVGFCCVGVLCDLANKDRRERWDKHNFQYVDVPMYGNFTAQDLKDALVVESGEMPGPMRRFMGLTEDEVADLYMMNDDDGATFADIADHIRTKLMPNALKRSMPFEE